MIPYKHLANGTAQETPWPSSFLSASFSVPPLELEVESPQDPASEPLHLPFPTQVAYTIRSSPASRIRLRPYHCGDGLGCWATIRREDPRQYENLAESLQVYSTSPYGQHATTCEEGTGVSPLVSPRDNSLHSDDQADGSRAHDSYYPHRSCWV